MDLIIGLTITFILIAISVTITILKIKYPKSTKDIYELADELSGLQVVLEFTLGFLKKNTDLDMKTVSTINGVLFDAISFIEGCQIKGKLVSERDVYYYAYEILSEVGIEFTESENRIFREVIQVIYLFAK